MDDPVAPPQSLEAERELLGSLLVFYTPDVLAAVKATGLKREDFYRREHEVVYRAIVAVAEAGDHVDLRTVARFLQTHSYLETIGGVVRLEFLASFSSTLGVRERAVMVAEDARWRERLDGAYRAIEACHDRDEAGYAAAFGEEPRLRVIAGGRAATA